MGRSGAPARAMGPSAKRDIGTEHHRVLQPLFGHGPAGVIAEHQGERRVTAHQVPGRLQVAGVAEMNRLRELHDPVIGELGEDPGPELTVDRPEIAEDFRRPRAAPLPIRGLTPAAQVRAS